MRDARIRFRQQGDFHSVLKRRVDAYFLGLGRPADGGVAVQAKAVFMIGWLVACWVAFLVFGTWTATLFFGVAAGVAMAGLGMAVQHDGGHGAFSYNARINRASAAVLDMLGASSYVWKVKHGHLHHTYPNIEGADDDIELSPLARLSPGQPHYAHQRWQHLYMWPLYAFVGLKWFFVDDFLQLARGRIGEHPLPRPKGRAAWLFWGGKAVYLAWAVVIPIVAHGWLMGIGFLVASQFTMGLILSVVFQLAHCVEEADFIQVPDDGLEIDFAVHQLATTVDFAPWAWMTWYVGGLNYQAVHHLFPRVSHVHYAAISDIVSRTCAEYGVTYKVSPSLRASLRSHYRWLRRMGRPDEAASTPAGLARAA
jgi:linoleoyl-CoA desaturase